MLSPRLVCCFLLGFTLSSCEGTIGGAGEGPGAAGPINPGDPLDPLDPEALCDEDLPLLPADMLRLTSAQYTHAIEDLTGVLVDVQGFSDGRTGAFEANGIDDRVSRGQVVGYSSAAERAATEMDLSALFASCAIAERACVVEGLTRAAARAFRQQSPEVGELLAVYDDGLADGWTPEEAARGSVMALLSDTRLIYREEDPAGTGERPAVTGVALASKLAFFLWSSIPDDALMSAAAEGRLDSAEGLSVEVDRMLTDDRSRRSVRNFHRQWLYLDNPRADDKRSEAFSPELAESMLAEAYAFVDAAYEDGGFRALMTDSSAFVDAPLAEFYGVPLPSGAPTESGLQRVAMPEAQRAGVMTLPRFLSATAGVSEPSWLRRGLFVRERLLCRHLPPPPPDAPMDELNSTSRTEGECASCHVLVDPIGQGFDEFDEIGTWRNARPDGSAVPDVDVRGSSAEGIYPDVATLARSLAEDPFVQTCYASQWVEYALGEADNCVARDVAEAFTAGDLDLKALLRAIALNDAFRLATPGVDQ